MTTIILIAHKFPPYTHVGARRWQKFTEYLSGKNIDITVITQKWDADGSFHKDHKNIRTIRIPDPYYWLLQNIKFLKTFIIKLEFLNRKLFKYTDEGSYFNKKAFKIAEQLIQQKNINVLIATSPPYSSNYYAGLLKKKYSKLKVIQDFRDAWIDGYFSWNNGNADSHPTYKTEVNMELFALNNCDAVVAVTPGLLLRLKSKIKDLNIRTELITNGFDTNDKIEAKELEFPAELDKGKLNICHFGTLDFGREDEFITFLKAINANALLADTINFVLIGNNNQKIENYILSSRITNIKLLSFQPPQKLSSFMFFSDMHLVVNDRQFYYAFGSKIFDAFLYKKPVILVSKRDALTDIIERLNIGLTTDNTAEENRKAAEHLTWLIRNREKLNQLFSYDKADLREFEIQHLSEKYFKLITDLSA